jgi:hypothetical protein
VENDPADPLSIYMHNVTVEAEKAAKGLRNILRQKYKVDALAARIALDVAAALEGFTNVLVRGELNVDKMKAYIACIRTQAQKEQEDALKTSMEAMIREEETRR